MICVLHTLFKLRITCKYTFTRWCIHLDIPAKKLVKFSFLKLSLLYRYGSPILDIKWHQTLNSERPKLITTDNHIVRIWDPETVSNSHMQIMTSF